MVSKICFSNYEVETFDESKSLYDYLKRFNISEEMLEMAKAGFANSQASNLEELSLKQSVHWYDSLHA